MAAAAKIRERGVWKFASVTCMCATAIKTWGKCIEWDFLYKISAKQCKIGTLPSVSFEQILLDPFADRILEARSKYIERRINKINFFSFQKGVLKMQAGGAHFFRSLLVTLKPLSELAIRVSLL